MLADVVRNGSAQRFPVARRKPRRNVQGWEQAASVAAGAAIAAAALLRRRKPSPVVLALGAFLLGRGVAGVDPVARALSPRPVARRVARELGWSGAGVTVQTTAIARSRDDVYAFWRDFGRLQTALANIESIEVLDRRFSRWTAKAPFGLKAHWTAEIVADEPGRRIAWRSTPDSDLRTVGEVEFSDDPKGKGTEVRVRIAYEAKAGEVGRAVATLLQREPVLQSRRDLRRIKQLMETGEVTTSRRRRDGRRKHVDVATVKSAMAGGRA